MKYLVTRILPIVLTFIISLNVDGQTPKIPTDKEISNAVNEELLHNASVPSYLIDVETNKGIVTLSGGVNNMLERDRAVQIARMVKGVRGVINEIVVNAPTVPDNELEKSVREALLNDPATALDRLNTSVEKGIVIIGGMVESWQEKQLAEYVVKGVRGVKDIRNNILVDTKSRRSDLEIQADIKRAIDNDVRIDGSLIEVSVDEGHVYLKGAVGSANEKVVANAIAWTNGVVSVDQSDLKVKDWARKDDLRVNKYVIKPDAEIKDAILDAFLYDPRVSPFNPDVDVTKGEVVLSGIVTNLKAKRAAGQDAKNIVGVVGVKNYLKVRPELIPDDKTLQANISKALLNDPMINRWDIKVRANNGIVYLNGTADSNYEKYHAENIVSKQKGVVAIENNLKIYDDNDYYTYDYSGWNSYYPPYLIDSKTQNKNDAQLKKDIEGQLWWSPYVNENEVEVTVVNGKAVLEGRVDTYREKKFAAINALEAGAKDVENNINVVYTSGQ